MLGDHDVAATLAITDIEAARSFYEGTLGLKPVVEIPDSVIYSAGKVNDCQIGRDRRAPARGSA